MIENFEDLLSLSVIVIIIVIFLVFYLRRLNLARAKKMIQKERQYYQEEE